MSSQWQCKNHADELYSVEKVVKLFLKRLAHGRCDWRDLQPSAGQPELKPPLLEAPTPLGSPWASQWVCFRAAFIRISFLLHKQHQQAYIHYQRGIWPLILYPVYWRVGVVESYGRHDGHSHRDVSRWGHINYYGPGALVKINTWTKV